MANREPPVTAGSRSGERAVPRSLSGRGVARVADRALDEPTRTSLATPTAAAVSAAGEPAGCLSVNATPFASVYVDGEHVGETPRACLRVRLGERRIRFHGSDDRSPERVVLVTERHTADTPLTVSYDFRAHQFREPGVY